MTRMTIALAFTENYHSVLLVQKRKPDWQAGRLNGVGGKANDNETFEECNMREFAEETGLHVSQSLWKFVAVEHDEDYELGVFSTTVSKPTMIGGYNDAREALVWVPVESLFRARYRLIGNLQWMVPLAMDWRNMKVVHVNVQSGHNIKERPSW